ncbi:MAG TPA: hypothetical protein VNO33_21750 [Kofleriaceae bacterium]|nr:hypothetical protein [Kofleriaceae bacterium]
MGHDPRADSPAGRPATNGADASGAVEATTPPTVVTPLAAPRSRGRRILGRAGQVALGVAVALLLTEVGFCWRDDGAFPHLHLYVADPELGVRLEPGEQKLQFRANPVTSIRVNADGYRGADLPAPRSGEILVVGDSQVFGLGVEEEETFSSQLAGLTGRPVVNGGVPTYGPLEYTQVVREMMARRRPRTVVYAVNFVNDLFENDRPNRDRHRVWDGWAVRSETAPEEMVDFPGRSWLLSRSHAVYALRGWLYRRGPLLDDRGFASEGTWNDLVGIGSDAARRHEAEEREVTERSAARDRKLAEVRAGLDSTEAEIEKLSFDYFPELSGGRGDQALRYRAARGSPGDIVADRAVEEGRAIALTAEVIRRGVKFRDQLERRIRSERETALKKRLTGAIASRSELEGARAELLSAPVERVHIPSVLEPRLREVAQLCRKSGAELIVVALPIDVAVSSTEWAKYGVREPVDMSSSRVLLTDLVDSAAQLGVRAVDVTDALAGVRGRAFLDHDIHMTPAGHRAVAEAIAGVMKQPAPLPVPDGGLPAGRTRLPDPQTWRTTQEAIVRGSSKARCETMHIGEWFRATCLRVGDRLVPSGIEVVSGGHGEAMTVATEDGMTLVTPLFEGEEMVADFFWRSHAQRFHARWKAGEPRPEMWLDPPDPSRARPLAVSDDDAHLCQCHQKVEAEKECEVVDDWPTGKCEPTCVNLYGAPRSECMAAYRDDCARLLACVRGDPSAPPRCPPGTASAGGAGQCFTLCSTDRPCKSGTCSPWQGAHICR